MIGFMLGRCYETVLEVKDAEALLNVASWPPSNVAGFAQSGVDGWMHVR